MSEAEPCLGLHMIDYEGETSFLNQSQSSVEPNQCNFELLSTLKIKIVPKRAPQSIATPLHGILLFKEILRLVSFGWRLFFFLFHRPNPG